MKGNIKKFFAILGICTVILGSIFSFAGCKHKKEIFDEFAVLKIKETSTLHRAKIEHFEYIETSCNLKLVTGYREPFQTLIDKETGVIYRDIIPSISIPKKEYISEEYMNNLCKECFPEGVIE